MSRIAGVNVPGGKVVPVALTSVYGIGHSVAMKICAEVKVTKESLFKDLSEEEVGRIRTYIDKNCLVEGDLRRGRSTDIKRLMDLGCYRGMRHRKHLPVRGQRTRTNARTHKGPSRPIAGKK